MSRHIDRISGPFPGRNLHWETWRCDFANKASQISGGQHSLWIEQELRYSRKRGLPSAKDAIRCYPLRSSSCTLWGLSIDIKSAHKLVKLRPSERGLVSFSWRGKKLSTRYAHLVHVSVLIGGAGLADSFFELCTN